MLSIEMNTLFPYYQDRLLNIKNDTDFYSNTP